MACYIAGYSDAPNHGSYYGICGGEHGEDGFYKIVHLDCGRKYFSVSSIESIIDTMSEAGYTHLQLAVGNDGLRFLLDDMAVTANDTTYSSDQVTAGIQAATRRTMTTARMNLPRMKWIPSFPMQRVKGLKSSP